jgi:hypothetical protein
MLRLLLGCPGEALAVAGAGRAVGRPEMVAAQLVTLGRAVTRPLPRQRAYHLYHRFAHWLFDRSMRRRLGIYYAPVDAGSPPPRELVLKTSVLERSQLTQRDYPDRYFAGGYTPRLAPPPGSGRPQSENGWRSLRARLRHGPSASPFSRHPRHSAGRVRYQPGLHRLVSRPDRRPRVSLQQHHATVAVRGR